MSFIPRPYQSEAIDKGVSFFQCPRIYHGVIVLPTGSGKSVVIANIALPLEGKTVVFQPSKEILEQNYAKFISYGYRAAIYSASAGQKHLDKVTFATIGSVVKKKHLFRDIKNIIIDECHLVNGESGMYHDFILSIAGVKVLGLTATPYRLGYTAEGAMLRFITRTVPRIFSEVLCYVQKQVLFEAGFLAKLRYFPFDIIDRSQLETNVSGTDYSQQSILNYYKKIGFSKITAHYVNSALQKRKSVMVFCATTKDAKETCRLVPGGAILTDETEAGERAKIFSQFKGGKIRTLVVCGIGTTGFDKADLETVVLARSMMSLSLYEQMIGRVMRPFALADGSKKEGWVIDLGGNLKLFGKVETMTIVEDEKGNHAVMNNGRYLTGVNFTK